MCETPYPPFAPTPHSLFSLHSAPSTVVIKEKLHPFVRLSPRIMDAAEWRGRKENRAGNGKNLPSFSSFSFRLTQLPSSNCEGVQVAAPSATWNNCFSNYCGGGGCRRKIAPAEENGVFFIFSSSRAGLILGNVIREPRGVRVASNLSLSLK